MAAALAEERRAAAAALKGRYDQARVRLLPSHCHLRLSHSAKTLTLTWSLGITICSSPYLTMVV